MRVVEQLEHAVRDRRRPHRGVDQEQLLFGAHAHAVGLDHALGEHALERLHVPQERLRELTQLLLVAVGADL